MPYVETQASGRSGPFVQAFWQATGANTVPGARRILPDACADFLFDLTGPTRPTSDCAAVIGTMTRAIVVPVAERQDVFGIRFRPGTLPLLWRLPMRALSDGRTGLDEVVADDHELIDRLSQTHDFRTRVAAAETWIERRLAQTDVDMARLRALATINARLEGTGGRGLTALTGWNERKLQRFFEASYGTTPATMRCFWRFERARRSLLNGDGRNLGDLAAHHGYADQAHLAREFRRFAGLSIGAWRAEAAPP